MTALEAAPLLELPADASLEQIEARFLELRRKLEDRIARAPTPGLQAKYRESLEAVTQAYETLTLAADGSALPVLKRSVAGGADPGPKAQPQAPGSTPPATTASSGKKKSHFESLVVAVIAVAALAAGGWFFLHNRAENAETARRDAEARAAATQAAEDQRLAAVAAQQRQAEAQRQAEEEKARAAAALRAEQERQDKILVAARVQLAEAKVAWSEFEAEARRAERDANEARAELRALRDAPAEIMARAEARRDAEAEYAGWAATQLTNHPARRSLVRMEELVSSRQADAAGQERAALLSALQQLQHDITEARRTMRSITGSVQLTASPGNFRWEIRDAFGQTQRGTTPATAHEVAAGTATVRFTRDGWPTTERIFTVRRGATGELDFVLPVGQVVIETNPENLPWTLRDALGREISGRTPARVEEVSAGKAVVRIKRGDWPPLEREIEIIATETQTLAVPLPTGTLTVTSEPAGAEVRVGSHSLGTTPLILRDAPAGPVALSLRQVDYHPLALATTVAANAENKIHGTLVSSLGENEYPVVYLFRPKWFNARATKVHVELQGQRYASLASGTYQAIRLKPGRYTVKVDPGALGQLSTTTEITVGWRQTYFYECAVATSTMSMKAKFALTPEAEARAAIALLTGSPTPALLAAKPL